MPVQLRDVAKRLKLSITTVSRALDGYDDVAATTRARVLRAAREMEYVPSRAARQLRRNRSEVIGYVLPASAGHFADSSFPESIAGLGDGAATRGFDLLVSTAAADSVIEKRNYTRWIRSRLVEGIVFSRMRLRDWRVAHLVTAHVPFVAHGRTLTRGKYPYIEVDSHSGFEELVATWYSGDSAVLPTSVRHRRSRCRPSASPATAKALPPRESPSRNPSSSRGP